MKKRILSFLLALIMVLGLFPVSSLAANDDLKVVVSMEGLTLGQGMYFEPKAYTLSEINTLVNGNYTKETLTAGIATEAFLKDHNVDYQMTGTWDNDAYLSAVKGIDTGTVDIPSVITDNGGPSNDENDGNDDGYLGEFDYDSMAGWMLTVNDFMIDVGCGQWVLADTENKAKCPSNLGDTYVVRWQFTLHGWGADLGVDTGWGNDPYFVGANKAPLYAAYAEATNEAKKAAALPVMEKLTATQTEVDAALADLTKEDVDNKTVTVKVVPTTAAVAFYAGDNATGAQISAADSVNGNYREYVLNVPEGTYCYRAKDGGTDLGGMSFTVGEAEEQSLTLVRTNFYTTDASVAAIGDYDIEIMPGSMRNVETGDQYIDDSSRVVTPTLLWANGNAMLYNWKITLNGALAENKGVALSINNTFADTLSAVQTKTFVLANLARYEIIAPEGAEVKMFNQIKNFNVEEIPEASQSNVEGGVSHVFRPVESANLTYRVSMAGKITRAGYMGTTEKTTPIVITFGESENPKSTENDVSDALKPKMENSIFVNVNRQNELDLDVEETYRLRAYRGAWEIINSDTANIMIEPDFNYTVLSGGEHISMTPAANRCTGNAKNNWMDIKGVSEGVAIIEVSYDAIIIGGSGTGYTGQYGATDPTRKSLVVVRVGENAGTLDMKVKDRDSAFDTELDTVYTVGDTASFAFTATLDGKEPTVSLSTNKGNSWKAVSENDGCFVAEGLVPGSNILKFEADGKTAYQVVRAKKVGYTLTNESRSSDKIYPGDKVTVTFTDTCMAIPKMSGIYNPQAHTLVYGSTKSASKQCGGYDLTTKCAITLTMPDEAGTATFENGYIQATMFCANDPMGAHRSLTDAGVGANFAAVSLTFTCGVYPTLTFEVAEKNECEHKWCDEEDCVITVKHAINKAGEKRYTCLKCGEYNIVATTKGLCKNFPVEVAAVEPTATKDGHAAGTWCSECHSVLSGMEVIPATGYTTALNDTLAQLVETVKEPVFGTNAGEWTVLALARGEAVVTEGYYEGYYSRVAETVKTTAASINLNGALHKNKSTENSRAILALTSIGKNPTNVGGVDLVGAYAANGLNWIKKQGINGPIFALIALDCGNYLPDNTALRQECIDYILGLELEGGGWTLSGAMNIDITAMALQALAPYKTQTAVAAAANRAFAALSNAQAADGNFSYGGAPNAESCAQVIVAATAWGIDPDTDSRFVKNGKSAIDALLGFYIEEGKGFAHVMQSGGGYTGGEINGMATDQAAYALVAYDRFKNGKTALYDMSDVELEIVTPTEPTEPEPTPLTPTVVGAVATATVPEETKVEENEPLIFAIAEEDVDKVEVTVPAEVMKNIGDAEKLELQTNVGTIVFDKDALGQMEGESAVSITMEAGEVNKEDGSVTFTLTATDAKGNNVFAGGEDKTGSATISVAFKAPEEGKEIHVYYVQENGTKTRVPAKYENGKLIFTVEHFSEYLAIEEKADVKVAATLTLPENIENKAESTFNAIVTLDAFPEDMRLIDGIIAVPEGVKVTGVTMGSGIKGGELSYNVNVDEGTKKLRFTYFDANEGTILTADGSETPIELMTVGFELENPINVEALTVSLTGMSFKKSSDAADMIVVNTAEASDTASLVTGTAFSVKKLYQGDGIDLIPENKMAIAVAATGIAAESNLTYKSGTEEEIVLKYNAAATEKAGVSTYLALVSSNLNLEDFTVAENYTVEDKEPETLTFGDTNGDGLINAQDALNTVNFWLRKGEAPSDDQILAANVTGDSRLNTFDALGIVEKFVDNKEFAIVTAAATAKPAEPEKTEETETVNEETETEGKQETE